MSETNETQLPAGWALATIEDLFWPLEDGRTLHQGWSPQCEKTPAPTDADWGVLKTTAIQAGVFLPQHNKNLPQHLAPRPQIEVKAGDILITCAGPRSRCGVACLVRTTRPHLMMSGKMYRFRVSPAHMDARFVEAFLLTREAAAAIDKMKTGGSDSGLNLTHDRFRRLSVPVAPLNEQRRLMDKIDELLSDLDAGVAALETVQFRLKDYRSAVLKSAMEGALTADWRAEHRQSESASEFLQRILAERRRLWETAQLAKFASTGNEPPRDWKARYKPPAAPRLESLPPLPPQWCWSTADQLCAQVNDGEHIQPAYQPVGFPMLTAKNVRDGFIDFRNIDFIGERDFEACLRRCAPTEGDVLIVSVGATTGRAAIVGKCERFAIVRSVLLLKPIFAPRFLLRWIQSPWCQTYIRRASGSSAQAHLYIADTKNIPVPLPPLAEQEAIVEIVEDQLSVIDHLEADIEGKLRSASALRQSILRHAFSGQLVQQDANDEPASELLRRIAVDREECDRVAAAAKQATRRASVSQGKHRAHAGANSN